MNRGRRQLLGWFGGCLLLPLWNSAAGHESLGRYSAVTEKPFDEVLLDLEFAITDYNYRLTSRNDIGAAIGAREGIDFPRSAVLQFCNLRDAREILRLAPDFLLHMPCRIAVREAAQQVVVEARLVPEDHPRVEHLGRRINDILRSIVRYAVD